MAINFLVIYMSMHNFFSDLASAGFTRVAEPEGISEDDFGYQYKPGFDHVQSTDAGKLFVKKFAVSRQMPDLNKQENNEYLKPADIIVKYFDMFSQLTNLLLQCNAETMITLITNLKASNIYGIPLFPAQYITKLSTCTDNAVLLRTLFPYSNWYDHSIIREIVGACNCPEAERVLDEFDSHIDHTLLITDYPIPVYSSTMIPIKSSTHSVMAIVCNKELSSTSLYHISKIKSIVVRKLCITKHAGLLLAIGSSETVTIFYCLIPKTVSSIIFNKVQKHSDYLYNKGILEVAVDASFILTTGSKNRTWSLGHDAVALNHVRQCFC